MWSSFAKHLVSGIYSVCVGWSVLKHLLCNCNQKKSGCTLISVQKVVACRIRSHHAQDCFNGSEVDLSHMGDMSSSCYAMIEEGTEGIWSRYLFCTMTKAMHQLALLQWTKLLCRFISWMHWDLESCIQSASPFWGKSPMITIDQVPNFHRLGKKQECFVIKLMSWFFVMQSAGWLC